MLETYGEMRKRLRKERVRETARFWMSVIQVLAVLLALWFGYWEIERLGQQTEAIRNQVEMQAWSPLKDEVAEAIGKSDGHYRGYAYQTAIDEIVKIRTKSAEAPETVQLWLGLIVRPRIESFIEEIRGRLEDPNHNKYAENVKLMNELVRELEGLQEDLSAKSQK